MKNRYQQQLRQQLRFIQNSCDGYDRGDTVEAIRIATAIRVLLHQTVRSTSLLTHLDATSIKLLSTTKGPSQPGVDGFNGVVVNFDGMALLNSWPPRPKCERSSSPPRDLNVSDWWNQTVIVLDRVPLSRKVIALTAANKDGGVHVDPELPEDYQRLIRGVWVNAESGEILPDHHALCLRQFGYELLNSSDLVRLANDLSNDGRSAGGDSVPEDRV